MKCIREEVRSANVLHTQPDKTIRHEHELAIERIEQEIEKYNAKLYDAVKERHRVHKPEVQKEILRKKHDADIELHVCPLNAKQLTILLVLSEANAYKLRSRYRANWKTLFFAQEFIQKMEESDE